MGTTATGTIAPEKILRELAEMWTALSQDPQRRRRRRVFAPAP